VNPAGKIIIIAAIELKGYGKPEPVLLIIFHNNKSRLSEKHGLIFYLCPKHAFLGK